MSPVATQIVLTLLTVLCSGGLLTAVAALRKGKVEGKLAGKKSTLDEMTELNDRLVADNLRLRTEVDVLTGKVSDLIERVIHLERALAEATK